MVQDKYIGLALAMSSSLAIGSSFVITKKGLIQTQDKHGFEGDGFTYLRNATWWAGMLTMGLGEAFNFMAYAFAPAILVTPLGALSVLIGSILGAYFLNERLGLLGKLGSAICLVGTVIIILHAPPDEKVRSTEKLLRYALNPGFMTYGILVCIFSIFMIYWVAPKYGKQTPLVYISICSTVGSISIMAVKAFGIALKLTFGGHNQFVYPSTYVFMIIVVVCILTQMNYFNKALSQFSTSIVNPLYFVAFTTFTLIASFLLFQGFHTTNAVNTISLLCGFLIIFSGVYLLNISRDDPDGTSAVNRGERLSFSDAVPTDGMAALVTRRSMQSRRSSEALNTHLPLTSPRANTHRRLSGGSGYRSPHSANGATTGSRTGFGDREALMQGFDERDSQAERPSFGLGDLAEDSDEDAEVMPGRKRTSFDHGSQEREWNGNEGLRGQGKPRSRS